MIQYVDTTSLAYFNLALHQQNLHIPPSPVQPSTIGRWLVPQVQPGCSFCLGHTNNSCCGKASLSLPPQPVFLSTLVQGVKPMISQMSTSQPPDKRTRWEQACLKPKRSFLIQKRSHSPYYHNNNNNITTWKVSWIMYLSRSIAWHSLSHSHLHRGSYESPTDLNVCFWPVRGNWKPTQHAKNFQTLHRI